MSLQRQLMIILLILFVILFSGVSLISAYLARDYLQQQLQSHATDAATSLGLILSEQAKNKDRATMVSMIDAVFDRGYYQRIQLRDMNGKLQVDRHISKTSVHNVPAWFINLVNLDAPSANALIMSGWQRAGQLSVQSHPGYAYQELWASMLAYLWYFVFVAAITGIFSVLAIQTILRPLQRLKQQAIAIMDGEFHIEATLPYTTELRQVTQVMNHMTAKLQRIFEEQKKTATRLRNKVYLDSVTGLHNELFLNNNILHFVTKSLHDVNATLMHIKVDGIHAVNLRQGHEAGNTVLRRFASLLTDTMRQLPSSVVARMPGADFAVLITNGNINDLTKTIAHLSDNLRIMAHELSSQDVIITTNIGIMTARQGTLTSAMHAGADLALMQAIANGPYTYHINAEDHLFLNSEEEWLDTINFVIAEDDLQISLQSCYALVNHQLLFHKISFHAANMKGQSCAATTLFPLAERYDLAHELNKCLIQSALAFCRSNPANYVIPVATSALLHSEFKQWLRTIFIKHADIAPNITLEVAEYAVVNETLLQDLLDDLQDLGVAWSLDHFGAAPQSFSYLRRLKLVYLKIDSRYTRDIDSNEDNQFYINSLVAIAHSLDIPIVAENVLTAAEFTQLSKLHIDAAQGDYLDQLTE